MVRQIFQTLLFLAVAAYSLPLGVGESWVWWVNDQDSGKAFFRSARVLDSKDIAQGRLWRIVARDSAERKEDTGTILAWPDGRQQWLRPSAYLRIELQAPSGETSTESGAILESDTLSPWGEVSTFPELGRGSLIQRDDSSLTGSNSKRPYQSETARKPLPRGEWSAANGLERMICYPHGLSGQGWILIQHNGRNVFQPMPSIRLPAPGAHWVWNMSASNASSYTHAATMHPYGTSSGNTFQGTLRWDILERLPDSSGWVRLKIQEDQKLSWDKFATAYSTYVLPGPISNSSQPYLKNISIDLRIQRVSGWILVSNQPSFPFYFAWISRWYNRFGPRSSSPIHLGTNGTLRFAVDESSFERSWFQMGMDSASLMNSASRSEAGFVNSSSNWARYRLLESNLPPEPIPENILEVARDFPESTIRWSTASGRTGTIAASEFVSRPSALRGKTLFLQARLPDGRLWQGTHVTP